MERPALPTLRQLAYLVELSERLNFRLAGEAQSEQREQVFEIPVGAVEELVV